MVAHRHAGILQRRMQAASLHRLRHGHAEQLAQRRKDVEQVTQGSTPRPARNPRSRHQQRHVHAVIVGALLAHQPVLSQRQAVVAREYDDGVVQLAGRPQGVDDPPHLGIQMADHGVVLGEVAANRGRGARITLQQLVAPAPADVERMVGQVGLRQRDPIRVVHREKTLWHGAGIVRRHERQVGEERPAALAAGAGTGAGARALQQELDGGVGEQLRGVGAGGDAIEGLEVHLHRAGAGVEGMRARLRVDAGGVEAAHRHVPVVVHAAEEDLVAVAEAARVGSAAVVPLAGAEGVVAGAPQQLRQHHVRLRDRGTGVLQVEQGAAGHQHGAARHAHRRHGAAHDVGTGEGGARAHQPVQVGRVDVGVAERADGVEALVVGEEEQDVGPRSGHGGNVTRKLAPARRNAAGRRGRVATRRCRRRRGSAPRAAPASTRRRRPA